MPKKRQTQLERAIANIDAQITVLQHARRILEQQQADAARQPRSLRPAPVRREPAANG
jgi:hypothetical protein